MNISEQPFPLYWGDIERIIEDLNVEFILSAYLDAYIVYDD